MSTEHEIDTADWALCPTDIPAEPKSGAPASVWADYNAAVTTAGMKRSRRKELRIGEFSEDGQ